MRNHRESGTQNPNTQRGRRTGKKMRNHRESGTHNPNTQRGRRAGKKMRNHRESGAHNPNAQREQKTEGECETTAKRGPKPNGLIKRTIEEDATTANRNAQHTPNAKERKSRINRNPRQTALAKPTPGADKRKMLQRPGPTLIATYRPAL